MRAFLAHLVTQASIPCVSQGQHWPAHGGDPFCIFLRNHEFEETALFPLQLATPPYPLSPMLFFVLHQHQADQQVLQLGRHPIRNPQCLLLVDLKNCMSNPPAPLLYLGSETWQPPNPVSLSDLLWERGASFTHKDCMQKPTSFSILGLLLAAAGKSWPNECPSHTRK